MFYRLRLQISTPRISPRKDTTRSLSTCLLTVQPLRSSLKPPRASSLTTTRFNTVLYPLGSFSRFTKDYTSSRTFASTTTSSLSREPQPSSPTAELPHHLNPPPSSPNPNQPGPYREPTSETSFKAEPPAYDLTFTCSPCKKRSTHRISKQGYHKGTVLITCPECKNRHLISDHLKVSFTVLEKITAQALSCAVPL